MSRGAMLEKGGTVTSATFADHERPLRTSNMAAPRAVAALLVLLTAAGPCASLRDVRVTVPQYVLIGHSAHLRCHYELEGDLLYCVKWYKGRNEFYRFTPKEVPSKKTFNQHGVHVDLMQSNATQVTLVDADPSLTGRYSCEVSADAPSFHTLLVSANMEVVEPPREQPHITGLKPRYRPGDHLKVSCTSGSSNPAATLKLYLNDQEPPNKFLRVTLPREDRRSDKWSSHVGLRMPVTSAMGPLLRLRCVASIGTVYWQSAEKSALVEADVDNGDGDFDGPPAVFEEEEGRGNEEDYQQLDLQPVATTTQPGVSDAAAAVSPLQLSLLCVWVLVRVIR